MKVIILVALAFLVAPAAAQADRKLDAMASAVAGHPVKALCTTDPDAWAREVDPRAFGYTYDHEPGAIHLGPYACGVLKYPRSGIFGAGLHILAHEAAHARGVRDEACAEIVALSWVRRLARQFYGVKPWSNRMAEIVYASKRMHEITPPEYRDLQGQC